jgi:hypothetical protein
MGVGAALAGIALGIGTPTAFSVVLAGDALSFFLSAAILLSLPAARPGYAQAEGGRTWAVFRDGPFVAFTAASGIIYLNFVMLDLTLPLWIVRHTAVPATMVTVLYLINSAAVVLFQVRFSRSVQTIPGAVAASRWAGIVLFVACVLFALSAAGPSLLQAVFLVAACLVNVVGEMLFAAGSWTISFTMAPIAKQGQYQGFYFMGNAATGIVAPTLLTFLLITWGAPGWIVLGVLGLAAVSLVGPITAWGERSRSAELAALGAPASPA